MNQTRVFLIFAWLMVATLLWMEWGKFNAPKPAPTATPSAQVVAAPSSSSTVPNATAAVEAPAAATAVPSTNSAAAAATPRVVVSTDVLRLTLDGGSVLEADLLKYPQNKAAGSQPVTLFSEDPQHFYVAQSGWVSPNGAAPSHLSGFVAEHPGTEAVLARGADQVSVPFLWQGPDGVSIRRTYTLKRGSYAVALKDEVVNAGHTPWQGAVYRQLIRTPPIIKSGMTNPESFSFTGATWYSDQKAYERRPFKDYVEDDAAQNSMGVSGGWIAMLQHHFFSAWIPESKDKSVMQLELDTSSGTPRSLIREKWTGNLVVAPGQQATTEARLYVGPKLVQQIKAQNVPGLERAVDYSRFAIFAVIGQGLFWILNHLHSLLGNWGWSIIGLVVLVKLALWPLSAAQYRSANKMRQFQPRIAQLKERYGDDRQKFQMAQMELYKKEKINPMGGCLPILVTMPIFLALYWVINESVELRQAPWFAWIQDLTARDPYFILPALNMLVMWRTQKMTPAVGMDPMQQKMMQFMPLVFGGMMALFPSGLVLYWVTNGSLGLLQQWWMGRHLNLGKPDAPEDREKEKGKSKPLAAK